MKPCGRTKFFQLRPQHVIEVGSAGTHSVCVCEKHQNVKIMIDCLCKNIPIAHLFMDKLVCDIGNQDCMMSRCASCPPNSVLLDRLRSFTNERETIKFQPWESTDRTALAVSELPTDDFLRKLVYMISDLTRHHFVAKQQGKYCRDLKETLKPNECLLQGDYSRITL